MKTRKELLHDLISLSGPIDQILTDLSVFAYDTVDSPEIIKYEDFRKILDKSANDEIKFDLLERWAESVEIRDDIDFVDEELKEFVFELANPLINGPIARNRILEMIEICGEKPD